MAVTVAKRAAVVVESLAVVVALMETAVVERVAEAAEVDEGYCSHRALLPDGTRLHSGRQPEAAVAHHHPSLSTYSPSEAEATSLLCHP